MMKQLLWFLVSSPAQWERLGKDWNKVALQPSGTGPFKVERVVPRERMELSKNPDYWEKARVPKLDKVILFPMPEAATRTAALRRRCSSDTPSTKSMHRSVWLTAQYRRYRPLWPGSGRNEQRSEDYFRLRRPHAPPRGPDDMCLYRRVLMQGEL